MTTAIDPIRRRSGPSSPATVARAAPASLTRRYGSTSLRVGAAMLWLSLIVLLPLAAIVWQSAGGGWEAFWSAVTSHAALAVVPGDADHLGRRHRGQPGLRAAGRLGADPRRLPGQAAWSTRSSTCRSRCPTIVASLVMLALYGPEQPGRTAPAAHQMGCRAGAGCSSRCRSWCASVQPVLLELDREVEEAAASLGANNCDDLHQGHPAGAAAVAAVRRGPGVLPGDRRVRLGGADRRRGARRDRGVLAVDPHPDRERRPHRCRGDLDCAAGDLVRRAVRPACRRSAGGQAARSWRDDAVPAGSLPDPLSSRWPTSSCWWSCRSALILWRTFAARCRAVLRLDHHPGGDLGAAAVAAGGGDRGAAQRDLRCPDGIGAGAQQIPRQERAAGGHRPAVRGVAGRRRCRADPAVGFGGAVRASSRTTWGFKIIFGFPGIVLASIFVTRAVRDPRGRTGAARAGHRPGGGGRHAGFAAGGRRSGGSPCRRSGGA